MTNRVGCLLGFVLMATPVYAHHSFGTFDLNRTIEIAGTIAGLDFVNPHSWLRVNVTASDGKVTLYRCEMRGATVLRRSGWTPEMFVVGERITVQGAPDREDPHACYVNTLVLADGRMLDRYTQQTAVATTSPSDQRRPEIGKAAASSAGLPRMSNGVPNLAGAWAVEQQLMTDPRGRLGTLVPASVAKQFAPGAVPERGVAIPGSEGSGSLAMLFSSYRIAVGAVSPSVIPWLDAPVARTKLGRTAVPPAEQHPLANCATTSIIFDWYWETVVHRISQDETSVTIEYGQHGFVRTIHLDSDRHPADVTPSRAGHSIGRWDGDVLVVDTIGFLPGLLGLEVAHGPKLHVVERFSLDADGGVLRREYVATDPDFFVGEYRGSDITPRSPLPFVRDTCSAELNPVGANKTRARK
jgi:uncharacterized protein DUF6152